MNRDTMMPKVTFSAGRAALLDDETVMGADFGAAYSDLVDSVLIDCFDGLPSPKASLVALGSYARRELCPASDVDVLLLLADGVSDDGYSQAMWYPLWDVGLTVGHATRNLKDIAPLAADDNEVLTSMLVVRHLAGDVTLTQALLDQTSKVVAKHKRRIVKGLKGGLDNREESNGVLGQLLEPDLKSSRGGLRDIHSVEWAAQICRDRLAPIETPIDLDVLVDNGLLHPGDVRLINSARTTLLDARVALHRASGRRSDRLLLQDQDRVAELTGVPTADILMKRIAGSGQSTRWITDELWDELDRLVGSSRLRRKSKPVLIDGIQVLDGRAKLPDTAPRNAEWAMRLAVVAAKKGVDLDRGSALSLRQCGAPDWNAGGRVQFEELLNSGPGLVDAVEELAHAGVFAQILPEWDRLRSLPQRNAYHRYTVDRHLLETVVECTKLFDDPGFDGDVARSLPRPHLLAWAALLHDIAKGMPGDHSLVGAEVAEVIALRCGLSTDETAVLRVCVRRHLLLPDIATRRDLSEEAPVAQVARLVGDQETLDLLYLLTVGDSTATGASAWGPSKAMLVRELYVKTHRLIGDGTIIGADTSETIAELSEQIGPEAAEHLIDNLPRAYVSHTTVDTMAIHAEMLAEGPPGVRWRNSPTGIESMFECLIVAADREGLLAAVAGVMAANGLRIMSATGFSTSRGTAVETYEVIGPHGRLEDEHRRRKVTAELIDAVSNGMTDALRDRIAKRRASMRRPTAPPEKGRVLVDHDASDFATVIEVHGNDDVGLLSRIAEVFSNLSLAVRFARVQTLGDHVVDTFYVRYADGTALSDRDDVERLRRGLLSVIDEAGTTVTS
ncbi:MAG: [protein-PII] uridylyltransferase [Acidimicrobiia bacterium]|nr:[protein-PII] uridylyltransferase [Acidimicrobiia bacterium]